MEKLAFTTRLAWRLHPGTGGARRFPSEIAVTTPLHHPFLSGHFVWSHLMSTLAPTAGAATNTASGFRLRSGESQSSESESSEATSDSSSSEAIDLSSSCPWPDNFVGVSPPRRPVRAARLPLLLPTVIIAPAPRLRVFNLAVRAVAADGSNLMVSEGASDSSALA